MKKKRAFSVQRDKAVQVSNSFDKTKKSKTEERKKVKRNARRNERIKIDSRLFNYDHQNPSMIGGAIILIILVALIIVMYFKYSIQDQASF